MQLKNYQDFVFDVEVQRIVEILNREEMEGFIVMQIPEDIDFVAHQSSNRIKNLSDIQWKKESGLLSIWILGMMHLSDGMTAILPYRGDLNLNTAYFGDFGEEYVRYDKGDVFFRCDGKYRSNIGLPAQNAVPVCGSFDADNQMLTIVQYTFNNDSTYVNSLWKWQDNP